MSRPKSNNRTLALKMWLKSSRSMKLVDIAEELGVSPALVRKWKHIDNWDEIPQRRARGGQPGNKNAIGNKGGSGGPVGNDYAVKHGAYRKYLPQDERFQEILQMASELDPLDMIWNSIEIAFAKLIDMQSKMYVTSKEEMIKELKKRKYEVHDVGDDKPQLEQVVTEEEYEFQFAWDRQATDIKAYSMIMRELRGAIKQYLSAAPENDERRAKLELMQLQMNKVKHEVTLLEQQTNDDKDKPIEIRITRKGEPS